MHEFAPKPSGRKFVCLFMLGSVICDYVVFAGRGDDDDEDEHSEAQVLSATCVVFTNYEGDVASVVDQHFSRSFSTQTKASFGSEKGELRYNVNNIELIRRNHMA